MDLVTTLLALGAVLFFVVAIISIATYIYFSLALMKIANRTQTSDGWMAWIPFLNMILMANIANMPWWPVLLVFPGGIFLMLATKWTIFITFYYLVIMAISVFSMIWLWKICEKRNRPGWWALLIFLPFFGFVWMIVLYGILAWGKE